MHDISLILLMALGFGAALIFGLITHRLGLSPIVGYLMAGVVLSPNTPGYVGDIAIATQLAELGVILLMFGVGLHFKVADLLRVKGIALPGAIGQSLAAVLLAVLFGGWIGLPSSTSWVVGVAISVASTVVLLRVLMDFNQLHTSQGHIAVGWLIVEDILTVAILVLLPAFAQATHGSGEGNLMLAMGKAVGSIVAAVVVILVIGGRLVPMLMNAVARTRSRELFMLVVLVVALLVAVGSATLFGVSMALGAFLAGLVVGQSETGHQAAAEALPFRDAFAVLFFVAVGMLFDPAVLASHPGMIAAVLFIVLVGKPLAAFVIVVALNYPHRAALTVGIALGQIGEFSFIVADLGKSLGFMDDAHRSVLVAAAIISITLNPVMFRFIPKLERLLISTPVLGPYLSKRGCDNEMEALSASSQGEAAPVIVVGYGPVGQSVLRELDAAGIKATLIDLNIDTIKRLRGEGRSAVFGDARSHEMLHALGLQDATHLILTIPDPEQRGDIVHAARALAPNIEILARSRYTSERGHLEANGVSVAVCEEDLVARDLTDQVLKKLKT